MTASTTAAAPPAPATATTMPTVPRVDAVVSSEHKKKAEIFTKARQKKLGPKIVNMCRIQMGLPPLSTVPEVEPMDAETSATIAAVPLVAAEAASAAQSDPTRLVFGPPIQPLPLPEVSSLADLINLLSKRTWNTPLRELQTNALSQLFGRCLDQRKLLIVQKTGGGKTHIIRTLGTMLKGIHVVLHPLLALTGDQVIRFQEGSNDYGMIEAVNLDARGKNSKWRKRFVEHISKLSKDTTSPKILQKRRRQQRQQQR